MIWDRIEAVSQKLDLAADRASGAIVCAVLPYADCEGDELRMAKLRYGATAFVLNAPKTILLATVAIVLGIFIDVAVFALAYGLLRLYSFGVHYKTTIGCTLAGFAYYFFSVGYSRRVSTPLWAAAAVLVICFVLFVSYAPAETRDRHIYPFERAALRKKSFLAFGMVAVCSLVLSVWGLTRYANLLLCAAVCQTINLLPITYRLLRVEHSGTDEKAESGEGAV